MAQAIELTTHMRAGLNCIQTLALASVMAGSGAVFAQTPVVSSPAWVLTPPVRGVASNGDQFGYALAASTTLDIVVVSRGDRTTVSSGMGSATHYVSGQGGWERKQRIVPPVPASGMVNAVAISGSDLVLSGGAGATSVWVYRRSSIDNEFSLVQELQAETGSGTSFGSSIALTDDALVVLEPLADSGQGCAHVFRRFTSQWSRTRSICGLSGGVAGVFARSASISDETLAIVVGSSSGQVVRAVREPFETSAASTITGAANGRVAVAGRFIAVVSQADLTIYDEISGSWTPVHVSSMPTTANVSGIAASPSGDALVIRAAEMFMIARHSSGGWALDPASDIAASGHYGADGLAIVANTVFSGRSLDESNTGTVRYWLAGVDSPGDLLEPLGSNEFSQFGASVAASGTRFVATSGGRFLTEVYSLADGHPTLEATIPELAFTTSLAGDRLMLGNGQEAKIYVRDGTQWLLQKRVTGATYGRTEFASAVAIGDDVAIAVAKNRVGSVCASWMYGFRRNGSVWSDFPSPESTYAGCDDRVFSQIVGSEIAVGTNGAVHIYDLSNNNWSFRQIPASGRVEALTFSEGVLGTVAVGTTGVRNVALHSVTGGSAVEIPMESFPVTPGATFRPYQVDVSRDWAIVSGRLSAQGGAYRVAAYSFRIAAGTARLEASIDVESSIQSGSIDWIGDPFSQQKQAVLIGNMLVAGVPSLSLGEIDPSVGLVLGVNVTDVVLRDGFE